MLVHSVFWITISLLARRDHIYRMTTQLVNTNSFKSFQKGNLITVPTPLDDKTGVMPILDYVIVTDGSKIRIAKVKKVSPENPYYCQIRKVWFYPFLRKFQ